MTSSSAVPCHNRLATTAGSFEKLYNVLRNTQWSCFHVIPFSSPFSELQRKPMNYEKNYATTRLPVWIAMLSIVFLKNEACMCPENRLVCLHPCSAPAIFYHLEPWLITIFTMEMLTYARCSSQSLHSFFIGIQASFYRNTVDRAAIQTCKRG